MYLSPARPWPRAEEQDTNGCITSRTSQLLNSSLIKIILHKRAASLPETDRGSVQWATSSERPLHSGLRGDAPGAAHSVRSQETGR